MPRHLPASRWHRPLQILGYLTHRRTGSDPSRDVLSLRQCKREQRAPTGSRNNPAVLRQHKLNGHVVLAEGSSNLPCVINTTFREKIYSRWCCIDRLSWHRFSGVGPQNLAIPAKAAPGQGEGRCTNLTSKREIPGLH